MRMRALVLGTALLVPLLVPGTAAAAPPVVHEHFHDEPYSFVEDCPGTDVDVAVEGTFHGQDLIKPVPGSEDAFFGHSNGHWRETLTNLATDEVFTVSGHGLFREITAELVEWDEVAPDGWLPPVLEEGDDPWVVQGPVYRFTAVEVGHLTIRDESGRKVHHARGRLLWEVYFDTVSPEELAHPEDGPQPGGVLLLEEEPVVLSGTFPFPDICAVVLGEQG